jgi:8-oxo-dGTP diphosphatase
MKLLKTIRDSDIGSDIPDGVPKQERGASRAVVFDADGNVALLHATKKHFHKLPGGGIEQGEDIETALRRELIEEIGCSVKNLRELGSVEEYRNKWELHQISYCFLADLDGEKGTPDLEEDEIADGFEPVWLSIEDAIKTLEGEAPVEDYEGKFIQLRDVTLLKAAQSQLG